MASLQPQGKTLNSNKSGSQQPPRTTNPSPLKFQSGAGGGGPLLINNGGVSMSAHMAAQIMDNGKLLQQQQSIVINNNNATQRINNLDLFMKDAQQQQNNSLAYHKKSFTATQSKLSDYIMQATKGGKAHSVLKGSSYPNNKVNLNNTTALPSSSNGFQNTSMIIGGAQSQIVASHQFGNNSAGPQIGGAPSIYEKPRQIKNYQSISSDKCYLFGIIICPDPLSKNQQFPMANPNNAPQQVQKQNGKAPSRSIKNSVFSSAQTPMHHQQQSSERLNALIAPPMNFAETQIQGALSNLNRKVKPLGQGSTPNNNNSIQAYVDQSLNQFTKSQKEGQVAQQKVRVVHQNQFPLQNVQGPSIFMIQQQQNNGGVQPGINNNVKKRSLILKSQTPTVEREILQQQQQKPSTHNGSIQQNTKNYLDLDNFLLDGGTGSVIDKIVDSFQGPNTSIQSNLRGKKLVNGAGQHARIASHGPPQMNLPSNWNLQSQKQGNGLPSTGLKNLDLDQHFEQFDLEVYNHIAQTKSPVINNRFFVDNSGSMNIQGGGNTQIRQVYGAQQQKPVIAKKQASTPAGHGGTNVNITGNLRKKTTSVEPPEILVELDYKSKSSIGYQRIPANFAIPNKMRFKKNSSDLDDIVLPQYGNGPQMPGSQAEAFLKSTKSKTPSLGFESYSSIKKQAMHQAQLQDQNLAQRSNFIFEENEEFKNIDQEVEQINAKNSITNINEEPFGIGGKYYQAPGSGLGHHQLHKPPSRTKFLNQTSNNQQRKKIVISKDKVAYNQDRQMFSPQQISSNQRIIDESFNQLPQKKSGLGYVGNQLEQRAKSPLSQQQPTVPTPQSAPFQGYLKVGQPSNPQDFPKKGGGKPNFPQGTQLTQMVKQGKNEMAQRIKESQKRRIFEIGDVRQHLEELTEDEDEIMKKSPRAQEQWQIKRLIRISFKRDEVPPQTDLSFYKIGRLLGKGAFGKVNMALQKLSRRLVAIKSINKKYLKDEHSINSQIDLLMFFLFMIR